MKAGSCRLRESKIGGEINGLAISPQNLWRRGARTEESRHEGCFADAMVPCKSHLYEVELQIEVQRHFVACSTRFLLSVLFNDGGAYVNARFALNVWLLGLFFGSLWLRGVLN